MGPEFQPLLGIIIIATAAAATTTTTPIPLTATFRVDTVLAFRHKVFGLDTRTCPGPSPANWARNSATSAFRTNSPRLYCRCKHTAHCNKSRDPVTNRRSFASVQRYGVWQISSIYCHHHLEPRLSYLRRCHQQNYHQRQLQQQQQQEPQFQHTIQCSWHQQRLLVISLCSL